MARSSTAQLLSWIIHCLTLSRVSDAFWFYGYDQVYRDPYPETTNNEIVQTSVVTYLASQKNTEITGVSHPYTYTLMMFESIVQYETEAENHEWNLGVWDSFIYCNEYENSLCLLFSDGMYCDNGFFRETAIELTCHAKGDEIQFFDINEPVECIYTAKLYFPELCQGAGKNTNFLRTSHEIEKLVAHSYVSNKGNLINTMPYTVISGFHKIGISMSISEIDDLIRITIYGPSNKFFGIGFGSNSMSNTYSIIVAGENSDHGPNFWEQKLDAHGAGYTLQPSFVLEEHIRHSGDNTQQITLVRRLSTALELDEYWLFSCVDPHIDFIWSVGKSTKFERHIGFGEDRLDYEVHEVSNYDKSQIVMGHSDFKLRINWTGMFVALAVGVLAFYIVRRYKEQILTFAKGLRSQITGGGSITNSILPSRNQYGSAASTDLNDHEPLMDNKL